MKIGAGVKVKICGITSLEDALAAVIYGADALGFVFYKKSPRYIAPKKAGNICRILPKKILKVGVFVNEAPAEVRRIARVTGIDTLQLHGDETPEYCSQFKGYKLIKALRIRVRQDIDRLKPYKVWGCLLDSFSPGAFGGTGKTFNWKLARHLGKISKVVFLSGGLNPGNAARAIRLVRPDWVDASSSLEKAPGEKDKKKIKRFINEVKS